MSLPFSSTPGSRARTTAVTRLASKRPSIVAAGMFCEATTPSVVATRNLPSGPAAPERVPSPVILPDTSVAIPAPKASAFTWEASTSSLNALPSRRSISPFATTFDSPIRACASRPSVGSLPYARAWSSTGFVSGTSENAVAIAAGSVWAMSTVASTVSPEIFARATTGMLPQEPSSLAFPSSWVVSRSIASAPLTVPVSGARWLGAFGERRTTRPASSVTVARLSSRMNLASRSVASPSSSGGTRSPCKCAFPSRAFRMWTRGSRARRRRCRRRPSSV